MSSSTDISKNIIDASKNSVNTSSIVKEDNVKFNFNKSMDTAFNKSNVILLVWFLVIYYVLSYFVGLFSSPANSETAASASSGSSNVGNIINVIFFIGIFLYALIMLEKMSKMNDKELDEAAKADLKDDREYFEDPYSIVALLIFMFCFYLTIYIIGIPMGEKSKPISIWIIENLMILMLVILIICAFFKYVLKIDLVKIVFDWFEKLPTDSGKTTTKDVSGTDLSKNAVAAVKPAAITPIDDSCPNANKKIPGAEVFNISNNLYTYDDAKAICKAYGARLATYDDVEDSYKKGGEWCNYGWSANQMAFFPTQKATWEELQQTDNHKNDCGRPGVNGGYFANPDIRFGVNCYGKKPKPSQKELSMMEYNKQHHFIKSPKEKALDDKVNYWKNNAASLLNLNSFNGQKWSGLKM
jgi:hypothetical protein